MKITIESTDEIVKADGVDCRVWIGTTENGTGVYVLIPRIAALKTADLTQFENELVEKRQPQIPEEFQTLFQGPFPLRMIL